MTTEQRFKKLLEIACDNGYDKETFELLENEQFKIINHLIFIGGDNYQRNSLNDLVFNTNFFECLFKGWKASYRNFNNQHVTCVDIFNPDAKIVRYLEFGKYRNNVIQYLKFQWIVEIDEKRNPLEWLFKQFEI